MQRPHCLMRAYVLFPVSIRCDVVPRSQEMNQMAKKIILMKDRIQRIHFIGIGGTGMSGIAEVMFNLGYTVTGSDIVCGATVQYLMQKGILIFLQHGAEQVVGADVVVISAAIAADNPEVLCARLRNIPVVPRAQMLAELMRLKQGIAVAGTHGKTTTTSLVTSVLAEAGLDPTFVIGGQLNQVGSHAKLGQGELMIVEADESDASFLYLYPVIAIVTNIDQDHMATYAHNFENLCQTFIHFLHHLPFYGMAVMGVDDENVRLIQARIIRPQLTYGIDQPADVRAHDVHCDDGKMMFTVVQQQCDDLHICLNLPGMHNVRNALAAVAVARIFHIADQVVQKSLREFRGVGRRFQHCGDIPLTQGGYFSVIDDYGHHPTEIHATLQTARLVYPNRRLCIVFQPHRYTRTRDLFENFVTVLGQFDQVILTDIYAAGEEPILGITSTFLSNQIKKLGHKHVYFCPYFDRLVPQIFELACSHDVFIITGAGSIGSLSGQLVHYGVHS